MSLFKTLLTGVAISLGAATLVHSEYVGAAATTTDKTDKTIKTMKAGQTSGRQAARKHRARYGANYFPNYELITQDGKKMKFFDDVIKDKIVVINFMFTSCKYVCPLETARIKEVYNLLSDRAGKDVFFYSISIDPERDTPEALKAYRKKYGVADRPGWTFLTGKEDEIRILRTKLGMKISDLKTTEDGQIDHNLSMVLGNQKTGRWIKRSPYESSEVLAALVGNWLPDWNKRVASKDYRQAKRISGYSDGAYIFRTRCQMCHSIGQDNGNGIGPDLLGVTKRRETQWLARWMMMPGQLLKEKDPIAMKMFKKFDEIPMPNLALNEADVRALLDYFESLDNPQTKPVASNRKLESIDGKTAR